MKHVVVGSSGDLSSKQIVPSILNNKIAGNGLYSLIDGFKGNNIDSRSIGHTANKIEDYRNSISLPANAKIYIDSAGYSFIKGDLAPANLDLAISLYHSFFQLKSDYYDFIFSLDIPYSLKFKHFNTKKNIYNYNQISIRQSIQVLKNKPELAEKFHLIYHFKTEAHYDIWQQLFKQSSVAEYVKCRAIGGMVSIKKVAGISIAPFVATTFQCLWDFLNSPFKDEVFRLHFLGINVAYDRFVIAFLERLFRSYLGASDKVVFTYDTIKFKRAAMYFPDYIYEFDGKVLHAHDPLSIPCSMYQKIYQGYGNVALQAQDDLVRKAAGQGHLVQAGMAPLTISSELAVDQFFEFVIQKYQMVDIMLSSRNIVHFKKEFNQSLSEALAEYPHIFGVQMSQSIKDSMAHVCKFHRWYTDKYEPQSLDQMSREFIKLAIHFPKCLT